MDLRSFSRQRQGCIYEIKALFRLMPLSRVLFVVDKSTDLPFLQQVMKEACQELPSDSPNYSPKETSLVVRLYRLSARSYDLRPFVAALEQERW